MRERLAAILLAFAVLSVYAESRGVSLLPDPPVATQFALPSPGLRVLVIESTEDRSHLPPDVQAAIVGTAIRSIVKNAGGQYRLWDDQINADHEPEAWFRDALQLPRQSLPWLVIANGKRGVSLPLPATAEAIEQTVGKYLP